MGSSAEWNMTACMCTDPWCVCRIRAIVMLNTWVSYLSYLESWMHSNIFSESGLKNTPVKWYWVYWRRIIQTGILFPEIPTLFSSWYYSEDFCTYLVQAVFAQCKILLSSPSQFKIDLHHGPWCFMSLKIFYSKVSVEVLITHVHLILFLIIQDCWSQCGCVEEMGALNWSSEFFKIPLQFKAK